ncbi:MAG TPA: cache domain-containing protein [Candidatus Acidoferrales bacterium]|nr:cache domain-containing protein [Candidatus Acidoferrales bacterium]
MLKKIACLSVSVLLLSVSFPLLAEDDPGAAALAAESESYCASTLDKSRTTPPETIIAKVNEACTLLEKEGPAAFPKFSGKGSPFLYEGTYVWVHTLAESKMLVHPIKYKMVGNRLVGLKDVKGKRFFVVMNDLVREKGEGWVEYYWPKPGSDEPMRKISFVKKCRLPDGTDIVVGSGLVNFSDADVAKLDLH